MIEFLIVGIGGFIGCCIRFAITKLFLQLPLQFPLATLISNVIAGFFIGFITELEKNSASISPKTKLFLTTGMMGGLSTFSTFSLETLNLFSKSKYFLALGNIMLNISLSFLGVILGMVTAKILFLRT